MSKKLLNFPLPEKLGMHLTFGQLPGASMSLALYTTAKQADSLLLIITSEVSQANQLQREINFFKQDEDVWPILIFPDWETLPYDHFSPHADIISERMTILQQLPNLKKGILLVSATTLMHHLAPRQFLDANSFVVSKGQKMDSYLLREQLDHGGYRCVSQVMEHGEYAIRGSLFDVFPMGSPLPYRLDFFADEVDSLRSFDPETQRTLNVINEVRLLPAHEFLLTQEGIALFRQNWRERFPGNPLQSVIYQNVSRGESAPGIEYYLPLFFEKIHTLYDYLPSQSIIASIGDIHAAIVLFWQEISERYEQLRHDVERPILPVLDLFMSVDQFFGAIKAFPHLRLQAKPLLDERKGINLPLQSLPELFVDHQAPQPLHALGNWLSSISARVLFCTETEGRGEVLAGLLKELSVYPKSYKSWQAFLADDAKLGMIAAPLEQGFYLTDPALAVITESQLFGQQVMQRRLRKRREQDADAIVRDLTELKIGAPVVHVDYGVGRYLGLMSLQTGDFEAEYLMLEYADAAKLYVPIASLNLISRYSGVDVEHAPLHRLGSGQWEKAKRKANEKIRDVAAELLLIYAKRAAKVGVQFQAPDQHYLAFAAAFPFEETPDQLQAINQVIDDMTSIRVMDRLVCGDVGFGKTEVAMRAAFIAVQSHQQVAVLTPTTLLAEQHLNNFRDRFAKWPVRIEAISRFRSKREQANILENVKAGKIDILIGTHKLLQPDIKFANLGLLIVDEEHRFGVRQKDRIKELRAEVDLLTLTATPIPRTLNMALANIRDLSIIATPPAKRLSVKTFVREYNKPLIREAILREIMRGGQVYFLHNEVNSMQRMLDELQALAPEARFAIAHGQMPEQALERVMIDFYHQRFNVLLCTTIIESGIDIPSANTIVINRADRFGLAQLHQLRGRVGRSHHQAYAYLFTPEEAALASDAKKRLAAIASLEDLGTGFVLATHDLEIRGAGELLGDEQSGHIQELGYSLYMELLDKTVKALQQGEELLLDQPLQETIEIDLKIPALIPQDYLPDAHTRLILYKRIGNAKEQATLEDLQVEMIDRFGLLPPATKNLFRLGELRLRAEPMGVRKIEAGAEQGVIEFTAKPNINMVALLQLVQKHPSHYRVVGNEKLKFNFSATTAEEKIKIVENLLQKLTLPNFE